MIKIAIAVPIYNESKIIRNVVEDLLIDSDYAITEIVLVDDNSTDSTYEILKNIQLENPTRIHLYKNSINLGHGKTLCRALSIGLEKCPDLIASCDGDGPILGKDLINLLNQKSEFDIFEVARLKRVEPLFRKLTTQATRFIVYIKSGSFPVDANTPIRIYQPHILSQLLPIVKNSQVPNLLISIISRRKKLRIICEKVTVLERKLNVRGTMWGSSRIPRFLPSYRFIKFANRSLWEVLRFNEK